MSSDTFHHLQQNRDKAFSRVKEELLKYRLLPNEHNKKLIRRVLKLAHKEYLIDKTLLSNEVWSKHQEMMLDRFNKVISRIDNQLTKTVSKASNSKYSSSVNIKFNRKEIISSRVRFMTLLHEVVPVDQDEVIASVERLEKQIRHAFVGHLPSVRVVGAIELEFVNLEIMRKATFEHEGKHSGERKRDTLDSMLKPIHRNVNHVVLVHLHAIIDLGPNHSVEAEDRNSRKRKRSTLHSGDHKTLVENRIKSYALWANAHQLQIKTLSESFNGRKKTLEQNLKHIAAYITKGANLLVAGKRYHRYKMSFDQDDLGLNEDLWFVQEGTEDTRNMPFSEIVVCAELLDKLMSKRRTRDGYVLTL
jgi:Fe-S cluster biosynthesis and repair protein YggX